MITAVVLAAEEAAEEKMPLIPHIPELVWGLVMVGVVFFFFFKQKTAYEIVM